MKLTHKQLILIVGIFTLIIAGGLVGVVLHYSGQLTNTSGNSDQNVNIDEIAITVPEDYSNKPIAECASCSSGEYLGDFQECTDTFEQDCLSVGGVKRWTDGHPGPCVYNRCYQKAPDTGTACSVYSDCKSGVCDLESAPSSGRCSLISKEFTSEGSQYYTARYSCDSPQPGTCAPAPNNGVNPGGFTHSFQMEDTVLVEKLGPGPIQ